MAKCLPETSVDDRAAALTPIPGMLVRTGSRGRIREMFDLDGTLGLLLSQWLELFCEGWQDQVAVFVPPATLVCSVRAWVISDAMRRPFWCPLGQAVAEPLLAGCREFRW